MLKKVDWGQWFLFGIGVVVVEIVSICLLWRAYPGEEMKIMGWAILILVIGFSGYATYKADEPDDNVRQVGMLGKAVLALLGVAALWGHSAMSRELSTSRQAKEEYQQQMNLQNQFEAQKTQRQLALKQADTQQLAAQAELEKAQTRKLQSLPPSLRGTVVRRPSGSMGQPSLSSSTEAEPVASSSDPTAIQKPKLESAVREEWMTFFQVINFLQILMAVLGALGVNWARHWDKKGIIGVPDFIERIWASGVEGKEYVKKHYGQYLPALEGAGLEPGKALA